jgi:hypothetical protein
MPLAKQAAASKPPVEAKRNKSVGFAVLMKVPRLPRNTILLIMRLGLDGR